MVFQKPNPFPKSIYENVAYGPKIHGIKNKKLLNEIVEKSLRGAAIWDEVKDRLKTSALGLSGGQQQRAGICRALINEPEIIFADEPTGALDTKTGRLVMDLFHKLNEEQHKTIVLITHSPELAEETDRIISIRDGNIVSEVIKRERQVL